MTTPPFDFERDAIYSRQEDIHAKFGGQQQGGIATPKGVPAVFLFTGEGGEAFGYEDGPDERGVYRYTGEGQVGDMTFERGNLAIRDHAKNSKALLLFRSLGKSKGYRYLGEYSCASYEHSTRPDRNKQDRQAIIFHLVPADEAMLIEASTLPEVASARAAPSLAELRARAYDALSATAGKPGKDARRMQYVRSNSVRAYVLARAKGKCESCLEDAPFARTDGSPYLEPHHTERLSDNGLDHPAHVAAVCPTCHREIHYGVKGNERNAALIRRLHEIESNRDT